MFDHLPLFPPQASTMAARVDALYFVLVAITLFFALLIATLIVSFAIRYRRRAPEETGARIVGSLVLEGLWIGVPLVLVLVIFAWGASLYFALWRPPRGALEIYVVGKQWMWKVQHPDGRREINELHVPAGRTVKLILGSEDVIHSFYVPAFRVKADAVPGRWTTLWFQATRTGRFHLFCAEYCGTKHSRMIGTVVVMEPAAFQEWLAGGVAAGSMAAAGQKLFTDLGCHTCHLPDGTGRGPALAGLLGATVTLADGRQVQVDEAYLREAIVNPGAKLLKGYPPIMPAYQGLISEEGLQQLLAYITSLSPGQSSAP